MSKALIPIAAAFLALVTPIESKARESKRLEARFESITGSIAKPNNFLITLDNGTTVYRIEIPLNYGKVTIDYFDKGKKGMSAGEWMGLTYAEGKNPTMSNYDSAALHFDEEGITGRSGTHFPGNPSLLMLIAEVTLGNYKEMP